MATSSPQDPFRGFRFRFQVKSIIVAAFSEVTIPDITVETVDYREGTDDTCRRALSGLTTYGRVTLRKGLTSSLELYNWHQQVVQKGASASSRQHASIMLLDADGTNAATWTLYGAWPTRYETSGLSAASSEIMIETMELAIDHMKREKS